MATRQKGPLRAGDRTGRRTVLWIGVLALAFAFRLGYGLTSPFWTEDERQVYLIGLQSFARGGWPYFGADVVWTTTRLPGAALALLIRGPLAVWPAPEAPFVLLNLLSFSSLALLAWYIRRSVPEIPRWIVWGALLTLPWTLNFSTHVVNPSYILPGAIVFFVGFLEAAPSFRAGLVPPRASWLMMGLALGFLVQIHLSWVLLPPYVVLAATDTVRRGPKALGSAAVSFVAGAAITGSLVLPTLVRFGWPSLGLGQSAAFEPQSPAVLLSVVARFLSFAAWETNRFLGLDAAERVMFFWRQPWVLPFAAFATIVGFVQAIVLGLAWFVGSKRDAAWQRIKWLAAGSMVWVYVSFFFSPRGQRAHMFYILFPLSAAYAAYAWRALAARFGRNERTAARAGVAVRRVAAATLAAGVIMHTALAIDRAPRGSLYLDRALVQAAIHDRDDRYLGNRRQSIVDEWDGPARSDDSRRVPESYERATAVEDLKVTRAAWTPVAGGRVSRFEVAIANQGAAAAYLDIRYSVRYTDAAGAPLTTRDGVIKEILEPGEHRAWPDIVNGMVPAGAASATLSVVGAERCVPVPRRP